MGKRGPQTVAEAIAQLKKTHDVEYENARLLAKDLDWENCDLLDAECRGMRHAIYVVEKALRAEKRGKR